MYKVEYLLLTNQQSACNTIDTLCHLLQSRTDITVSEDCKTITYDGKKNFQLNINTGEVAPKSENQGIISYFDITIAAQSKSDIGDLTKLLKVVRTALSPISDTSSIQTLWDDVSSYYSELAYPNISKTENLMRKLISKFMYVNVGGEWVTSRVPSDVKSTTNKNNNDSNYLFNIDFIKLKDVLLSESYPAEKEKFIRDLKTSKKDSFTREEIASILPLSNWDKYFSLHVNCESEQLDKSWTKLYELRCKVAHNKTFTFQDLEDCRTITKELDPILEDAINKLGDIALNQAESEDVFDEVVSNSRNNFVDQRRKLMQEYRRFKENIYKLSTPHQRDERRTLENDIALLRSLDVIDARDSDVILQLKSARNGAIHSADENMENPENWNSLIRNVQLLNDKLRTLRIDSGLQ